MLCLVQGKITAPYLCLLLRRMDLWWVGCFVEAGDFVKSEQRKSIDLCYSDVRIAIY